MQPSGLAAAAMPCAGHSGHGFQPEIQGLRAVSVLAVIWGHAGLPGLPGGFTGVDVFFVISGFLITRLLLAEMTATGRIDLLRFWARRARRLLPNALAALLATVLLATFVFQDYDLGVLRRDVGAAVLEIANFRFAQRGIDYFAQGEPASPILHFWSLSVEEQFYLVWPLLLVAVMLAFRSWRRPVIGGMALVWCISFVFCLHLTADERTTAYFHTGARCWQLVTGALIAACWHRIETLAGDLRRAMAWLGAAAIVAAMTLVDEAQYPGAWALLPTLGAAALIAGFPAAAPRGMLRGALGAKPMLWIGERSYSWYLWHWPLMALPRLSYPDAPYIEVIAIPVSLGAAMLAYAYIEKPMRDGRLKAAGPLPTFAGALAAMVLVVGAGYAAIPALRLANPELGRRMEILSVAARDVPQVNGDGCHLGGKETDQPLCAYGHTSSANRVVLFGDSHAAQWFAGVRRAAERSGWELLSWTRSACTIADLAPPYRVRDDQCRVWREKALERLTGTERPDLIIIANANFHSRRVRGADNETLPPDQSIAVWKDGLRRTIDRLLSAGVQVAVLRDTPVAENDFRNCIMKRPDCVRPRHVAVAPNAPEMEVARSYGDRVLLVDLTDSICGSTACPATRNGVVVYRDTSHLTSSFTAMLAPQLSGVLESAASRIQAAEAARANDLANMPTAALHEAGKAE